MNDYFTFFYVKHFELPMCMKCAIQINLPCLALPCLILFLDFYKAFDTIEHQFLLKSLKLFGFGDAFVDTIAMFYNGINRSVVIHFNTSNRFDILCGVRQDCPISPFYFY